MLRSGWGVQLSIQDRFGARDTIRAAPSSALGQAYPSGTAVPRAIRNGVAIAMLFWAAIALSVVLYVHF